MCTSSLTKPGGCSRERITRGEGKGSQFRKGAPGAFSNVSNNAMLILPESLYLNMKCVATELWKNICSLISCDRSDGQLLVKTYLTFRCIQHHLYQEWNFI